MKILAQPAGPPVGSETTIVSPVLPKPVEGPAGPPIGAPEITAQPTEINIGGPQGIPGSQPAASAKSAGLNPLFIILPLVFLLILALATYFIHRRKQIKNKFVI